MAPYSGPFAGSQLSLYASRFISQQAIQDDGLEEAGFGDGVGGSLRRQKGRHEGKEKAQIRAAAADSSRSRPGATKRERLREKPSSKNQANEAPLFHSTLHDPSHSLSYGEGSDGLGLTRQLFANGEGSGDEEAPFRTGEGRGLLANLGMSLGLSGILSRVDPQEYGMQLESSSYLTDAQDGDGYTSGSSHDRTVFRPATAAHSPNDDPYFDEGHFGAATSSAEDDADGPVDPFRLVTANAAGKNATDTESQAKNYAVRNNASDDESGDSGHLPPYIRPFEIVEKPCRNGKAQPANREKRAHGSTHSSGIFDSVALSRMVGPATKGPKHKSRVSRLLPNAIAEDEEALLSTDREGDQQSSRGDTAFTKYVPVSIRKLFGGPQPQDELREALLPPGGFPANMAPPNLLTLYHGEDAGSFAHPVARGFANRTAELNDKMFASFYYLSLLIGTGFGIYLFFATERPRHVSPNPDSVYESIRDSATIIFYMTTMSGALSFGLFWLMANVGHIIIGSVTMALPATLSLLSAFAFVNSFSAAADEQLAERDYGLRWSALIPLCGAALFARIAWKRRTRVARVNAIISLALDVIKDNRTLLLLSVALSITYALVSIPFVAVLARIFLVQRSTSALFWPLDSIFFLTLCYAGLWTWTSAVFRGIQKVSVASIVGWWYFHRAEVLSQDKSSDGSPIQMKLARASLSRALGASFGSICFSGFLLGWIRLGQMMVKQVRLHTSRPLITPLAFIVDLIEAAVNQLSGLALTHVGVTGSTFLKGAVDTTTLIRGSLAGGLVDLAMAKTVLDFVAFGLSLFASLMGFLLASHGLHAVYASVVALICFAIPFGLAKLWIGLIESVMDAVYVCYALDLGGGTNHCSAAFEAFDSAFAARESV